MQDPDDTIHEMQEEINEQQESISKQGCQIKELQSEIDRLTELNLQLRLIADRAVALLLGGTTLEKEHLSEEQAAAITEYFNGVGYADMEDLGDDSNAVIINALIKPLLAVQETDKENQEPGLLKLAMIELDRKALIAEEMRQLEGFRKLRPQKEDQVRIAQLALRFARDAGLISKQELVNFCSPTVILSRQAATQPAAT